MQFSWGNLSQDKNFKGWPDLCRAHRSVLNNWGVRRYPEGYGSPASGGVHIGQSDWQREMLKGSDLMLVRNITAASA